jgi:hypothetical protein
MRLAGHSNAATHMRYVAHSKAMQTIPTAALPALPPVTNRCRSPQTPMNHNESEEGDEGLDKPKPPSKEGPFVDGGALLSRWSGVRIPSGVLKSLWNSVQSVARQIWTRHFGWHGACA